MAQAGYKHEIDVISTTAEGEYKKAKLEADYQIQIKQLDNIDNAGERQNRLDQINTEKAKQLAIIDSETKARISIMQKEVDVEQQSSDIKIEHAFMMTFKDVWGNILNKASETGKTLGQNISAVMGALGRLAKPVMPTAQKEGRIGQKTVAETKSLHKRVKIVRGPDAGKYGWIREIKHGAFKGAEKRYYVDIEGGGQANNLSVKDLRIAKDQGVAEGQVNELSGDLLKRAAQVAKDKSDKAMDPKIHAALGGGYMNPLAKHYNTVSDKFSNRAAKVGQRDAAKNIASPAVMRKIGMAEGSNNSKTIITEALIAQKLWENAGRKLMEAQLTADQITQIFQQIQQDATAAGGNRTLIGKGKDAATAVSKAWTDLKDKIYNSKPMTGFAAQYDKAAEKLKQATGGDAGAMKYVQKYRDFATKNPMLQSAIYAALIAASGISGVGIAGAAALGLFKLVDQALQGKDIRSAAWSGVKTGATAFAAGQIGQALKGQPGGGAGGDLGEYPDGTPKMFGDTVDIQAQHGDFSMVPKVPDGTDSVVGQWNPSGPAADTVGSAAYQTGQQAGVGALKNLASDPNLSPVAQKLAADLAAGKNVSGAGEYLRKAMNAAAQKASMMGDMPDDSANAGMRTFMSLQNLFKAVDDAGLAATLKESVTLSESQIFFVIGKIVERQRKLDEGIMDTIKGAAGKAVNYAKTKGTNLTTKITADKLLQAWKKAGSPMDSATVAKVIQDAGVPATSVQQVYGTMKIPFDAAPAAPAASTSGPGDPTPLLSPAQLAAKRDPAATTAPAPVAAPAAGATRQSYAGMKDDGTPYSNDELRNEFFPSAPETTADATADATADDEVAGDTAAAPNPFGQMAKQMQNYGTSTGGRVTGTATGLKNTANPNNPNAVSATTSTPAAAAATTTATTTNPAAAAAGKFPGEDPQGSNYVGRREVARRQAARDADAAKKPATPNFAGPTGYASTNYAPNIKTGINLPKPAAAPAAAAPVTRVTSGGPTADEKDKLAQRIAQAVKEPVAEMLQMVETKEDVQKIKQFVDQTFVRYGAVNESAFAVRNQILEHVTQVGAQRRREHARMS
jgi:hypothetical protein